MGASREELHGAPARPETNPFAEDVRRGLGSTPKSLPPKWFYDEVGCRLYEQITEIPEYYLTRTEAGILSKHATAIVEAAGSPGNLIELGSGSAQKTRILLRALGDRPASYRPVDLSDDAMRDALPSLRAEFPRLDIQPRIGEFATALGEIHAGPAGPTMVMFLGSSIGNLDGSEAVGLLRGVRTSLGAADSFLLGTDLLKDPEVLRAAYDDRAGVTAAFNLNLLARINRELGGAFLLASFRHVAIFNAKESRIEIYLESMRDQSVPIRDLGMEVGFVQGERIHTENCHKYTLGQIARMTAAAGLGIVSTWADPDGWFALSLLRPV